MDQQLLLKLSPEVSRGPCGTFNPLRLDSALHDSTIVEISEYFLAIFHDHYRIFLYLV